MTVLVTGATGFVGQRLRHLLDERQITVRITTRSTAKGRDNAVVVPDIGAQTDWSQALTGVHSIVHLAARVHVMRDQSDDPLRDFRAVNTAGTVALAEQAANAGVRRFVYLSTVKVNGAYTTGVPFRESDIAAPSDSYAVSKWEAERRLHEIAQRTGLEVVIIRPPLVYGPGVKGNVLRLLRWIELGIPLPFANVENHRSLISLDNLADFILHCLEHTKAAGETFLISDGQDISTAALVRALAAGMGKRCRMFPFPTSGAQIILKAGGKEALFRRLWGDLQVDVSKARNLLDWGPHHSPKAGLEQVGRWYKERRAYSHGSFA